MITARAASALLQEPNMPLLRALKPESEILDRISEAFARMLAFGELDVHLYFEELPMGKFGRVRLTFFCPDIKERAYKLCGVLSS